MHKQVWKDCLEVIKKHVPSHSFSRWFSPIVPLRLRDKVLVLQVPSPFYYEWIEANYLSILREALHKVLGKGGKLEYSICMDTQSSGGSPAVLRLPQGQKGGGGSFSSSSKAWEGKEEEILAVQGRLHSRYVFENFIEGDCNRLAYQAAYTAAMNPGHTAFNPLLIYGDVGLGKTHLLQSIAHRVGDSHRHSMVREGAKKAPPMRWMYLSSEQFLSQFVHALKRKKVDDFCQTFMSLDVLLVDDIQFLRDKKSTQEVFFHIFNHLHQGSKQLVFTSDVSPAELPGIQDRLISRFRWGLTAELILPDTSMRESLLRKKAAAEGLDLPEEMVAYLANHLQTNMREMEGVIVSLLAHVTLEKCPLSMEVAKKIVSRITQDNTPARTKVIDSIHQAVSLYFQVDPDELKASTRRKEVVLARKIAMYLSKHHTDYSLQAIGDYFGHRDHSTVAYAVQSVGNSFSSNKLISKALKELNAKIKRFS